MLSVKLFRVSSLARAESFLSYCVWDQRSRQAAFIDPHLSITQEYVDYVTEERLKPVAVLETQLHYSHPTGAHELMRQFRVEPVSGNGFALGDSAFEILGTPGVRPDARVIRGQGIAFTGETLWIGAAAGFGMPGSDVRELWKSLQILRQKLAPGEIIFPGYDALELGFSTWGRELEKNPDLKVRDADELARLKARFPFHLRDDFQAYGRFNSEPESAKRDFPKAESPFKLDQLEQEPISYASITPEKLSHKKDALIVDVRDPGEFAGGHIPGARNIPLGSLAFALEELRESPRVYVHCGGGRRGTLAAATLSYLGFKDVVLLTGGYRAWQNAGLPTEK